SGRLEVRYPAAAGSGIDSDVVLGEHEERSDIQAVSIDLPMDVDCQLSAKPGLVVLRCQGRMTIRGKLSREAPWSAKTEVVRDPGLSAWGRGPKSIPETLSTWLLRQRALRTEDPEGKTSLGGNWTVLIAGGDLDIPGSLSSRTPLLLV